MLHKNSNSTMKWKRIEIGDTQLASEGLIGIEECTDYNDSTTFELSPKIRSTLKSPKRKIKNSIEKPRKKKCKVVSKKSEELLTPSKSGSSVEILAPSKSGSSLETNLEISEDVEKGEIYQTWSKFGLPDSIINALAAKGFREPTTIQSLTLPAAILGQKDIVGAAETGSGKTLAFGLPILTGILKEKEKSKGGKPLYALILTPTRELAIQVKSHIQAAAKYTDINVAVVIGGLAAVKQERILSKNPEIVVATPGRLWELIQEGNKHLSQVDNISYLVIDETDRMLEAGHFEELHSLLERINFDKSKSEKRQNFVFSATLSLVHDVPKYLSKKWKLSKMTPEDKLQKIIKILGITNPKIVDITQGVSVPETLTESRISCSFDEKDYYLYYFLQKCPGRTLIFCNSVGCVKRLANLLGILGCKPLPLHASMQQRQRLKNLERFRDDDDAILVATDVAARGLDIPKIEHVLHYQTPRTSESYIHRSGRTARASQNGLTLLLMEPSEIANYIKLCKTLNRTEDLPSFPIQEDYLKAVRDRVNLAREIDKLNLDLRKTNAEEGWLQKAAKEMDIIVDDFSKRYENDDTSSQKRAAEMKRKQLSFLLARPVFPKGFSGKYPHGLGDFLTNDSAVQLLKNSAASNGNKRKNLPLFKPKKVVKTRR